MEKTSIRLLSLCCKRADYACILPEGKSFQHFRVIPFVNFPDFFHKLKTQLKKWKSVVPKPVFGVELNSFHRVFNRRVRSGSIFCVQFVIFKSVLWQNFERKSSIFWKILQQHFDECWSLLKNRFFSPKTAHPLFFAHLMQFCCILWEWTVFAHLRRASLENT